MALHWQEQYDEETKERLRLQEYFDRVDTERAQLQNIERLNKERQERQDELDRRMNVVRIRCSYYYVAYAMYMLCDVCCGYVIWWRYMSAHCLLLRCVEWDGMAFAVDCAASEHVQDASIQSAAGSGAGIQGQGKKRQKIAPSQWECRVRWSLCCMVEYHPSCVQSFGQVLAGYYCSVAPSLF